MDIPSHVTILNQSEFSISTTTSAPGWNQSILNKQSWRSSFSRKRFWSQKRTFLLPLAMTAVCHIGHCLFSLLLDFQKFPIRFDILPTFFPFQLCKSCNRGSPMMTTFAPLMKVNDSCIIKTNFQKLGREPWSCVYWRQLMFERSWV